MFFLRKIVIFISNLGIIFDKYFTLPDGFFKHPQYVFLSVGGIGFLNCNKFYFNRDILLYILMIVLASLLPVKITFIILNIFIILGIYFIHNIDYEKNTIPEYVMIDKAVGVLIPMIVVSNENGLVFYAYMMFSIVLYHIFTKYKFWIINLTYKKITGNLAVIVDDIVAGIMVCLVLIFSFIFI